MSTGEDIFSAKKCVLYSEWDAQLIGASDYRQPIPICLKHKDLKGELEHTIHSTHMHQTCGTCMCAFTLFPCFLGQTNDPSAQSSLVPSPKHYVTGTWSKKWDQGKFGNRAIEVRSFSGFATGLGSGVVPPGMSL